MSTHAFHPAVVGWFDGRFAAPTAAQQAAWPAIQAGEHTLVAAPTGSGKTLTAFLAALDTLVREGIEGGGVLPDETRVVYVSPLKALSNDIHLNLEEPLEGIRAELARHNLPDVAIRTMVRTGDTPSSERSAMRKRPPHILVTTPESLYVLLGSQSGRAALATTRTVIVDEIHAVAGNKRGSHLALSLERLESLCQRPLQRIGLSATQKPIDQVAQFLVGAGDNAALATMQADGGSAAVACRIVDIGYARQRDLALEVPPVPLSAVMSGDAWSLVYERIAELVREHRTTLVFVNTRRMAERAARQLAERLGTDAVAAHHGSLSREHRLDAEQRLKSGNLQVMVATASLELGIDIGEVDLVCQLGSPRAIATFLQRVGRAGHSVGGTPKGRLFPNTLDDLVECVALLDAVGRGELDALRIPVAPRDVLAQQLVAEVASKDWDEDALFALVRRAQPYSALAREAFDAVVRMLAEGFNTQNGTRSAYLHRDAVHGKLRGRRNARLTALTSGGTIADTADYAVVLEPQAQIIGSVNEDFAIESMAGDIFQLGNQSYRILRVERDRLRVEDARGMPPNIPFWLGEAPGRSDELSAAVSRLRAELADQLEPLPPSENKESKPLSRRERGWGEGTVATPYPTENEPSPSVPLPAGEGSKALPWLVAELGLDVAAARQLVEYLAASRAALGMLPTSEHLAMERFFDESGAMQLVIHAPLGSRINRAWGLALRKRFCRRFNFELQAAATDDAIVLSLATAHSFPLDEVSRYLHSDSVADVLTQALLDAPLFTARWRWNATNALALPRFQGGRKVPAPLQRMKSEDLLASVFPDQVACLENIVGERQIPDHPLVAQTLDDCLGEAMDVEGLRTLLVALETGTISMHCVDLPAPSAMAQGVLNAAPYAFLDDAPLEERRTRAVQSRSWQGSGDSAELGGLDPQAIAKVREEAWPRVRDAEEMHQALLDMGGVTRAEVASNPRWNDWLQQLARQHRATQCIVGDFAVWTAAERLKLWLALHSEAKLQPPIEPPPNARENTPDEQGACLELIRAQLSALGPVTAERLAADLHTTPAAIAATLATLQSEGSVMQGQFEPDVDAVQWCERHLLARIHRYTLGRLRREIEPVSRRDFLRFLLDWQHLTPATRMQGPEALPAVLSQLEGFEAAAGAWEPQLLADRIADYSITWLDELCRAGRSVWARLGAGQGGHGPVRATRIVLAPRAELPRWQRLASGNNDGADLSSRAAAVHEALAEHGALFFTELMDEARLLEAELEDALGELVAAGLIHADSFSGLRALLAPNSRRQRRMQRRMRHKGLSGIADAGRWARLRQARDDGSEQDADLEHLLRVLLRRYGVICWRLLEREASWLPPWRQLRRVCQRLEARGDIRGGRFVDGLVGEQFALPEAVEQLRRVRARPDDGTEVTLSGCDPLNLVGTLLAGDKLPAIASTRILYRDGIAIAALIAGKFTPLIELAADEHARAHQHLLRPLSPSGKQIRSIA